MRKPDRRATCGLLVFPISPLGQKSRPFAWQVVFESGENQLRAVGQKGVDQVVDSMTVRY